jgi:hypothetical protein
MMVAEWAGLAVDARPNARATDDAAAMTARNLGRRMISGYKTKLGRLDRPWESVSCIETCSFRQIRGKF